MGLAEICPWVPWAVCLTQGFWLCPCCPLGPSPGFPVPGLTSEGRAPLALGSHPLEVADGAGLTPGSCASHLEPGDGRPDVRPGSRLWLWGALFLQHWVQMARDVGVSMVGWEVSGDQPALPCSLAVVHVLLRTLTEPAGGTCCPRRLDSQVSQGLSCRLAAPAGLGLRASL